MGGGPHDLPRSDFTGGEDCPMVDATEVSASRVRHEPQTTSPGEGALAHAQPSDSGEAPAKRLDSSRCS